MISFKIVMVLMLGLACLFLATAVFQGSRDNIDQKIGAIIPFVIGMFLLVIDGGLFIGSLIYRLLH